MAVPFRRILVPHDFSDHASRALRVAAALAREHRGRLSVLHVVPPFHPVGEFAAAQTALLLPPANLIREVRERLERLVRGLVRGSPVRCQVLIGDPYDRIMAAARQADSIVMATAGRSGLAHLVMGSVAEKVVRHASIPVLTLRPTAGGRAGGRRGPRKRR